MRLEIQYDDPLTPFLQRVISEKPQWIASALKSAGFWSQKQIKAGIKSGAPGGRPYTTLMPAHMRRRLEMAFGNDARRSYKPMGKLANAVGYDKTKANQGIVTVGWLSQSAVRIGTKQEKGFFTQVTDKLRGAFMLAGIYFPQNKTQIAVPARQTYEPMKPVIARGAPKQVELKLINYLQGATKRSQATSKRVYRVYQ